MLRRNVKSKRNFSKMLNPTALNRKKFSRNFAEGDISDKMKEAIEEAIQETLSDLGRKEQYEENEVFVNCNENKYKTQFDSFIVLSVWDAIMGGISLYYVNDDKNKISELDANKTIKILEKTYSPSWYADNFYWDSLAEDSPYTPEELKEAWINNDLDYDNPEDQLLIEKIDDLIRSDEEPALMNMFVSIRNGVCEVSVGPSESSGYGYEAIYECDVPLTGNENKDIKAIVNAIHEAGEAL